MHGDLSICSGKGCRLHFLAIKVIRDFYRNRKCCRRFCRSFVMNVFSMILPFITAASKVCYLFVPFFILQTGQKRLIGEFLIQPFIFQGNIDGNLIGCPIRICQYIDRFFLVIFHPAFMIFVNNRILFFIRNLYGCRIVCFFIRCICPPCLTARQYNNPDNHNDHCPIKQFIL